MHTASVSMAGSRSGFRKEINTKHRIRIHQRHSCRKVLFVAVSTGRMCEAVLVRRQRSRRFVEVKRFVALIF